MLAKKMVELYGSSLVGRIVDTQPVGSWPGGLAKVTEINPDPNAPDIVLNVLPLDKQKDEEGKLFESMGVFSNEEISLTASSVGEGVCIPELLEKAIKAHLRYSFKDIRWDWEMLTPIEKRLIPKEAFLNLKEWCK